MVAVLRFDYGPLPAGGAAVVNRRAVKAIVHRGEKISLLEHHNPDGYKFPGGGVRDYEDDEAALRRELAEECGMELTRIGGCILEIVERRADIHDAEAIFQMTSYCFDADVGDEIGDGRLETYETKLRLRPVWVRLDVAQRALAASSIDEAVRAPWAVRELAVLTWLAEHVNSSAELTDDAS